MTPPVSSVSGLVSGIDWDSTIQQLMAIESRPVSLLESRKSENETKLSLWRQMNTKLQSLESTTENFQTRADFLARLATSSDTQYVSASATGDATPGTHTISSITSLARANNYVSGTGYASANSAFGQAAGSITINLADHPDGAKSITLTYGTDYGATSSIADLCELINSHTDNDGLVTASYLNDGSASNPYKVVITAANSGTDYRVTSITDTSTNLNLAEGLTAQNCVFNIDSISVSKNSNQIDDVLDGVTLTLTDSSPTAPIILTVENDLATVKSNVNSIVNTYNEAKALMNTASNYDEENEILGPLLGDGNLSSIRAKLDAIISSRIPGLASGANYSNLSQIGISTDGATGLLSVDGDELSDALEDDFTGVGDVFCEDASSDNGNVGYIQRTTDTEAGDYQVVVNYDGSGNITSATINGNEADIMGTLVQGKEGNPEEGLLLRFTWPGSGSQTTANLNLSLGVNCQFKNDIDFITATELEEGEVYWAEERLEDSIENLDEQIEAMERRLEDKEEQLRRQFTNLEIYLSQMQSQSSYISSVLNG